MGKIKHETPAVNDVIIPTYIPVSDIVQSPIAVYN